MKKFLLVAVVMLFAFSSCKMYKECNCRVDTYDIISNDELVLREGIENSYYYRSDGKDCDKADDGKEGVDKVTGAPIWQKQVCN